MRTVVNKTRQGPKSHNIYTEQEARDAGILYAINRRDLRNDGEWVLTDDGFVVQAIRVGMRGDQMSYLRTCTGTYPHAGTPFTTEKRECLWTFNGKNPGNSQTRRSSIFARLVARGVEVVSAYQQTHPKAKNVDLARTRAFALLEKEHIKKVIVEELGDTLKKLGLDKEFVLKGLKELAQEADNDSVRFNSLKHIGNMVGLGVTKEESTTHRVFLGIGHEELAEIQEAAQPEAIAKAQSYLEEPAEASNEHTELG